MDNRDSLAREGVTRENEHETFLDRVKEHNEAIEAVDQALQLVGTLANNPSLAQTVLISYYSLAISHSIN